MNIPKNPVVEKISFKLGWISYSNSTNKVNQLRLRHLLKTKALKIYDINILTIVYSQLKALYNGSQPSHYFRRKCTFIQ